MPSPLIIPPLLFACLRLCLLLRLCSCRGGGSPAHSRVSVAALGLALASALVIAPSPIASPALSPASAASVALWLTRARASPLLPLGSHSPLPSSSRPRSSSRQRRRCPCLRALARSGLQKARRGGARIRPAALRLQEADPSQEYVAKGCPGMTACSSHSPWPFWPVVPPILVFVLWLFRYFSYVTPSASRSGCYTGWSVCGLVEEGAEGSGEADHQTYSSTERGTGMAMRAT